MPVADADAPPRIERAEFRHRNDQRNQQQRYPRKNPITLQREKEIIEEQQKREEEQRRQKEIRILHSEKKMNAMKSVKPAKKAYQEEVNDEEPEQSTMPPPKTMWGKFMRWLNT